MGGWNKGKALIDWNARVKDKFGESFRLVAIGEPNRSGERVIRVECSICGTTKDVSSISFRGKHGKDGHCEMCSPNYHLNDYLLLMKRARVEKHIKEQNEKIETEKRKTSKRLKSKQIGLRFCKECNLAIIPIGRTYCDNCSAEHHKANSRRGSRKREHKRRIRITGGRYDKDITLEKLYERDKGICYICGRVCDWNDYKIVDEAFIVGGGYPSVEHVVALCNGGLHTWDNVKLACCSCNTKKGRKLLVS